LYTRHMRASASRHVFKKLLSVPLSTKQHTSTRANTLTMTVTARKQTSELIGDVDPMTITDYPSFSEVHAVLGKDSFERSFWLSTYYGYAHTRALSRIDMIRHVSSTCIDHEHAPSILHQFASSHSRTHTRTLHRMRDLAAIFSLAYFNYQYVLSTDADANPHPNWVWAVWSFILPVLWLLQGTFMWALFVVGHDCAHGGYSASPLLNSIFGHFYFGFILVPHNCWKFSHRHHHANTGNMDKDEIFFPERVPEGTIREETKTLWDKVQDNCYFMLGVGWVVYQVLTRISTRIDTLIDTRIDTRRQSASTRVPTTRVCVTHHTNRSSIIKAKCFSLLYTLRRSSRHACGWPICVKF